MKISVSVWLSGSVVLIFSFTKSINTSKMDQNAENEGEERVNNNDENLDEENEDEEIDSADDDNDSLD